MPVNYRSLVSGGFFSSQPFDKTIRASIRCNNPGAINGAAWEKNYPGFVDTVETTPGNKTTIFEAPEFGVAVWWELLRRYASGDKPASTVGQIITRYGGGQDYSDYLAFVTKATGLVAETEVALDDDDTLLAFGKAMFRYEAGVKLPWRDEQILYGFKLGRNKGKVGDAGPAEAVLLTENVSSTDAPTLELPPLALSASALTLDSLEGVKAIQSVLIHNGYLDAPADGGFGPITKWALGAFAADAKVAFNKQITDALKVALLAAKPLPLVPGNDLAGKIVRNMLAHNYWIARHPDCYNIVYVEGMNFDGSLNDNRNNVFNDLRLLLRVKPNGVPEIVGKWEGTTEPSRKWTLEPMNPGGAFHIKFGQYKAWIKGTYHDHDALTQAGSIDGYRDPHKTFKRDFNYPVHGADFGVHHHGGYNLPHDNMGNSSAGCLVGRLVNGHQEFMNLVMKDPRYLASASYKFIATVMPGGELQPTA